MHEALLFTVGIVVGVMNAIAGGGMLLGFPVLVATGMPALTANATTGLIVLPGQLSSAFGYRRYIRRLPPHYLLLTIPCLLGGAVGGTILGQTSPQSFSNLVPWLMLVAIVLFAYQPFLHQFVHKHLHGPTYIRRRVRPLLLIGVATVPLAVYGGYFGAGLGFIMLAFLGFTKVHNHMHQMNALKNLMAACVALGALAALLGSGLIDWRDGSIMAIGNLLGGYFGALGAQKVPSHALRFGVIMIGLAAAGYLATQSYTL
jgi:uncharacterized membrane protein YfcA